MRALLLWAVMTLPPALFAANFAGTIWYVRDHADFERTRTRNPRYFVMLTEYEAVGGVIGALPGMAVLLTLRGLEKKGEQASQKAQQLPETDETVWPPRPA